MSAAVPSPAVSVVTVVYNEAATIEATVRSVLAQTHPRLEYVVIDGGSTDGTVDILRRHAARIDVLVSERDGGIYDAMNKGVARAGGDYVLMMNAGDRFAHDGALAALASRLVPPGDQVVFGGWLRREADRVVPCTPDLGRGLFNHQAILYSRALHRRFGDYVNVRGFTTADYLFFATLLASGVRCEVLSEPVAAIDVQGISAGLQTRTQKEAIDYLCGRSGRARLAAVAALHPLYHRLRRWLPGRGRG